MPSLLAASLAVVAFAVVFIAMRVLERAQLISRRALQGVSAILDPELSDEDKERAAQQSAMALFGGSFDLVWRCGLALLAAASPVYLAQWIGLATLEDTWRWMLDLRFLAVVTVIAFTPLLLRRRPAGDQADAAEEGADAYSPTDRFFHELAFSGPRMLHGLARVDDRLHARAIAATPPPRPVFITSLARAGTTALLNAFDAVPGTAMHRYRQMPFLASPLLWKRMGAYKKRKVERRQRAHGDGLEIDLDTPEAFDEVFWQLFWPEHYEESGIRLWSKEELSGEASAFFDRHMRKIVLVDGNGEPTARYFSKNNANIARLALLPRMFPQGAIIVPVRRPGPHAASLHRQHKNFLAQHRKDAFTKRYMRDIGHLEFGELHRPLCFPGVGDAPQAPEHIDYWLHYWISVFRAVRDHAPHCHFVLQDDLRAAPAETMGALCDAIDLPLALTDFRSYFRDTPDAEPTDALDPALKAEADALYEELATYSIRENRKPRQ
ncbi:MAG: sulfotransferase [Pseudomonadota bacterium]